MQIMESWMFGGSERVGFGISDGVFPPFDSTSMPKETLSEWGMGIACNHNSISHTSRQGVIENPTVLDSGVCAAHDSIPEGLERGFIEHRSKEHDVILGSSVLMKADEGEKEEGSKTSSSIVDPDAQYSSLIDLKLGRLSEWRGSENSKSSKIMGNFLTQESVNTAKRTRSAGTNGKAPLCQVHGCNMDLSSFKDYYKRHKVCQVHSKTAKVIVNGIQQRFCQQCSRFHLLSEFDDGKRSCRKRLAGHNERRRKPQIVFQSGKSGMMLPCYGSNFLGTPLSDGILHNVNCERIDWSRPAGLNTSPSMQMQTSTFHMRTDLAIPRDMEKEISFANGNATVPRSTFSVYASQFGSGISASNSIFDAGDIVKDFTRVPDSNRARSLLSSSQQANLCVYPLTIPVTPLSNLHKNDASESKLMISDRAELALQGSSNTKLSFGVDTPGYSQATFMQTEIKSFGDLESQMRRNFHGSPHFGSTGSAISHEHCQTTDLLRPSTLPQGAESRKRSLQVKQPFASLPIS